MAGGPRANYQDAAVIGLGVRTGTKAKRAQTVQLRGEVVFDTITRGAGDVVAHYIDNNSAVRSKFTQKTQKLNTAGAY